MMQLVYDGTMAGFLTAIFTVYDARLGEVRIVRNNILLPDAFARQEIVVTDAVKARRVWKGLDKKQGNQAQTQCYWCYLSGLPGIEDMLLRYIRYAFNAKENTAYDFGHPDVIEVAQTARKVGREKHRMEAFVRFRKLKDGLFYAAVEPDYNVLPIILPHFKSRYADMDWLIFDSKRRYGIHYSKDTEAVSEVLLQWAEGTVADGASIYDENEERYQVLWKDYFKHTGIPARKNPKLHLQHVPARYWRFLTEKQ
jgi:probable DNA metabolism protein